MAWVCRWFKQVFKDLRIYFSNLQEMQEMESPRYQDFRMMSVKKKKLWLFTSENATMKACDIVQFNHILNCQCWPKFLIQALGKMDCILNQVESYSKTLNHQPALVPQRALNYGWKSHGGSSKIWWIPAISVNLKWSTMGFVVILLSTKTMSQKCFEHHKKESPVSKGDVAPF